MRSNIFPSLFKRVSHAKTVTGKHLIKLRESKQYRHEQKTVLVQGLKTLNELRDQGADFASVIVTAPQDPQDPKDICFPARVVLDDPNILPADRYLLTDVELTRRILGTASRPSRHEVYAELVIKDHQVTPKNHLLVLDSIGDPGNVGTLVRTAKGLGWDAGLATLTTCDLYNDKAIRASRGLTLTWSHETIRQHSLLSYLKEHDITPVVADMLPSHSNSVWSPDYGTFSRHDVKPGSGLWFWNFGDKKEEVPKKIALILSDEHHGVEPSLVDEIKVSVPLHPSVESLNVASAGSIIMTELNRLLRR
ncbi:Alpha/beta knot methyltransferase [Sporodiniella umbellata]|nr:Alpha/beta knot methyltransferase [Sporodiniella umbellata]